MHSLEPATMMVSGATVAPKSPEKAPLVADVGDCVTITYKGQVLEAAVLKTWGEWIQLLFEDNETCKWIETKDMTKVVKGGAEELRTRAARAAIAREEAEMEKRRKAEEAERIKKEKEAKEAARKAEEKRIHDTFTRRARKAFDWPPTGVYFNTDHLPIPDHQKDIFRIVWYEIDVEKNYKRLGKPTYAPDNQPCGGRVYYTDGTFFATNYIVGSNDGALKGDGPYKALAECLDVPFNVTELEIKEAFDGGRTLKKFDAYPNEDPVEWVHMETEFFKGKVRKDEVELEKADPPDPHWWVW